MNSMPNPYEVTTTHLSQSESTTPERIWRIRFVVSMWVCGVVGIQCIPIYPYTPEFWVDQVSMPTALVHCAWIAPFCCSVASVICSVCLFRLPRLMDKLGAVLCVLLVGFWPGYLALNWWLYFSSH